MSGGSSGPDSTAHAWAGLEATQTVAGGGPPAARAAEPTGNNATEASPPLSLPPRPASTPSR